MSKNDEVKKCLNLLKSLGMQIESLKSLNLEGFDMQYLQGSLFYINHIKSNLNSILLGRPYNPETDKELDGKNERNKKLSYNI